MGRVPLFVLAAVGGVVLGFLLGGMVATGTGAGDYQAGLFQTAGGLVGTLLATVAVAVGRKQSK
jgi:hypothetical protein